MEDTSFPPLLYRYRAVNNWLDRFYATNYISTLAELNDPCEEEVRCLFPLSTMTAFAAFCMRHYVKKVHLGRVPDHGQ